MSYLLSGASGDCSCQTLGDAKTDTALALLNVGAQVAQVGLPIFGQLATQALSKGSSATKYAPPTKTKTKADPRAALRAAKEAAAAKARAAAVSSESGEGTSSRNQKLLIGGGIAAVLAVLGGVAWKLRAKKRGV
jgi:hypothetical protein